MISDKPVLSGQEFRHQYSLLGLSDNLKTAKITLSAAGKNQNANNERWVNIIHSYHDNLISH